MLQAWEVTIYRTPAAPRPLGRYLVAAPDEEGALRQAYLRTWKSHHCVVEPAKTDQAAPLPYRITDTAPKD